MDVMVNSSYSTLFKFYFNNHDVIIVTHDLAHYTPACREHSLPLQNEVHQLS